MPDTQIKALLFDMGGVLCRLNDPIETFGLRISHAEFMRRWLMSTSVREFERGAIDATTFARSIVVELNLGYSAEEFLQRFDSWPDQLFPGTIEMIEAIPHHFERAVLSNTNAAHWTRADIGGRLEKYFEKIFLSYETGLLKPDAQAFEHAAKSLNCQPNEILFFDDNPLNVTAAENCGYESALINEFDDLWTAFAKHKILSA